MTDLLGNKGVLESELLIKLIIFIPLEVLKQRYTQIGSHKIIDGARVLLAVCFDGSKIIILTESAVLFSSHWLFPLNYVVVFECKKDLEGYSQYEKGKQNID